MSSKKLHGQHKFKISTEMYLKTILLWKEEHKEDPRAVDVAAQLNLAKGSVSEMLKKMVEEKLITVQPSGITLTAQGLETAKNVLRKYLVVKDFLLDVLHIAPEKVHEEACELEHSFSDESIAKLNVLIKSLGQSKGK
jgi:DtxR family transcriptional regulator, Mn-dependent transcriptional regulator